MGAGAGKTAVPGAEAAMVVSLCEDVVLTVSYLMDVTPIAIVVFLHSVLCRRHHPLDP